MTLHELIDALWTARVTLGLRGTEPVAKGPLTREILAALTEHRAAVIDLLRGLRGARLEGLECGVCVPQCVPKEKVESERMRLRHCPNHNGWATAHYPRRA